MLFQLRGCGHSQNDARPNFFPDFENFKLGLSDEVSYVTGYFQKVLKIKKTSFPHSKGAYIFYMAVQVAIA